MRAEFAWRTDDLGAMKEAVADAQLYGATKRTAALAARLASAETFTGWSRGARAKTAHFVIVGDGSNSACEGVGRLAEEAAGILATTGHPLPDWMQLRIHVTGNRDRYAAFLAGRAAVPGGPCAAFLPEENAIVVCNGTDRVALGDSLRRAVATVHLRRMSDQHAAWLDAGIVELCGCADRPAAAATAAADEVLRARLRQVRGEFGAADSLMVATWGEFESKPLVRRTHAWSVVHLLTTTTDPELKPVLGKYMDALIAGRSAEEAYGDVVARVFGVLDSALTKHIDDLCRPGGR